MRRAALLLYGALFVTELGLLGVPPLVPVFERELGLSTLEAGAFLAAASVATLVASVPAGIVADRAGPRRLTIVATALVAVGMLGQGLAPEVVTLLVSRAVFGVGTVVVWTAGLAWLAEVEGGRRGRALGATMTVAGLGAMVAPALYGLLAERFGVVVPLALTAGAALVVTGLLAALPDGARSPHGRQPLRETLRASRDRLVLGSVLLMALGGLGTSAVALLVPLQLHDNGLDEGDIGVVFSVTACVFIAASAAVARRGDRAAGLRVGGFSLLGIGALLVLLVASPATPALIAFLLLRAPLIAVVFTVSYPLGARGAERARIGAGTAMALLNMAWGAATSVGPLAAGALASWGSDALAYGVVLAATVAGAAWMLAAASAPEPRPAPAEP